MSISVLSPDLKRIGIVGSYESLVHTREFAGSGSFKLKAPFTPKLFDLLQEDNILLWKDAGKTRAVYIESVVVEADKDIKRIEVSGKNLRGLLGRRIIWNNFSFNGNVEDFVRRVVSENAVSPSDTTRIIPNLILAPKAGCKPTITTVTYNENIEELMDSLTAAYGVGFDISFVDGDSRKLQFFSYEGVDRRTTQKATPRIVISRERNNVISEAYTRSSTALRNTALISGYTDEETGKRYEDYLISGSGLERREMYIQGSSSKPKANEDEGITEEQACEIYAAEQRTTMQTKLAEQVDVNSLEVELDGRVVEKIDVGDKVTAIEKELNLITQTHISAITTYYEKGGKSYDVTLGNAVPDVYKKLRKGIR